MGAVAMHATVATIELEGAVLDRLRRAGYDCRELDPDGDLGALTACEEWCAAIIGMARADPISMATSLTDHDRDLAVLVLCLPGDRRRLVGQLGPAAGRNVRVRAAHDADGLLLDLAGARRRRRLQAAMVSGLQTASRHPDPAAAPYHTLEEATERAPLGIAILGGDGAILKINRAAELLLGWSRSYAAGRVLVDRLPAEDAPTASTAIAQCLAGSAMAGPVLVRLPSSGRRAERRLRLSVARLGGAFTVSGAAVYLDDVTDELVHQDELARSRAHLEDRVVERTRALSAANNQLEERTRTGIIDVARTVLQPLETEAVLHRILEAARELTGARYAALGVLDRSQRELERFLTSGLDEATGRRIGALPRGRGVLGELIDHPNPLRVPDVSTHPRSYGFPPGHPPMRSFLGVPILVGERPFGNLYLTDKRDAREFGPADEQAALALAELAGIAIDHARRFTDSEARRIELQQTVDALDATIQIARALGGETELAAILRLVAKRGRALVSARAVVIQLLAGEELVVAEVAGEVTRTAIDRRIALEGTVASFALRAQRTQRLDDELNRSRFQQYGLGRLGLTASDGLVVPLIFRGRPCGVLTVLDRLGDGGFSPTDERLLEAFASSVATAVATAQTVAAEHRRQRIVAAEAERARWARELHDETLQAMANVRLILSAARKRGDREAIDGAVGQAIEQLAGDISDLRALIADLRPAALDALGVEAAIGGLGERVARVGLELDIAVELGSAMRRQDERLSSELEVAIYRIVQEALTNAVKHGAADHAVVEVHEHGDRIHIRVTDDGRGFDPSAATSGFGLAGMRERIELLDGTLELHTAPGEGAAVVVELPVLGREDPGPAVQPDALPA